MKVYLLLREGPEWTNVIGVYGKRASAEARAKVLNDAVDKLGPNGDVFEHLSVYRVEDRKVIE